MRVYRTTPSAILNSCALILGLFCLVSGGYSYWQSSPSNLLLNSKQLLLAAFLVSLAAQVVRVRERNSLNFSFLVLGIGLILIFLSDWFLRGYNLLLSPWIRGEIILFSLLAFSLSESAKPKLIMALLPITMLLMVICFWLESAGQLLFSDDHASFIWRLMLLKKNFPQIPFYYLLWNGGIDARDFFATGVLNVFILLYPLWGLFEVVNVYNYAITIILFVVLPCSLYCSAKLLRLDRISACLAGILALSFSLLWYRWSLKYGTLGFITSATLIPINLALLCRLIDSEQKKLTYIGLVFVLLFSVMLLWTMSGVVFIPALIILCAYLLKDRVRLRRLTFVVVLLCLLNLPWLSLFWKVSNVSSFLKVERPNYQITDEESQKLEKPEQQSFKHKTNQISIKTSLKTFKDSAITVNPLILILVLPGLVMLRPQFRVIWGATALWLLLLGSVVVSLKPQLELDRMLLLLFLISIVPSGHALAKLLLPGAEANAKVQNRIISSIGFGFLLASILTTASALRSRSLEKFYFATSDVNDVARAIRENAAGGRVLFSGFVLHELSHGHVAPLSEITQVPLIASSPVHNLWRYRQVFPESFIAREDQGIRDYLDLYNVSCVFAHERSWREYFKARPDEYLLLGSFGRFAMFKRLGFINNYFSEGQGEVLKQSDNALELRALSSDLVLKFNYYPFLESSACELSAVSASPEVNLIKLSGCPIGQVVTIRASSPWKRAFK